VVPLSAPRARPLGLVTQLVLLWRLRLTLARGALPSGAAAVPALLGLLTLGLAALSATAGTHALFTSARVAGDGPLTVFLLLLVGFLVSTMWMVWPVVTAGVDDAAELSRFALFPVSSGSLFLASVVAALVEPRTLPLWGALCGTGWALVETCGVHPGTVAVASLLLALLSVVWGRVGLHLVLNVLRHRRSAEAMGAGLLLFLGLAALVPPPDLSWVRSVGTNLGAVDGHLMAGAVFLFTALPTGGWAWMLLADAERAPLLGVAMALYLLATTVAGYMTALLLLERFHRRAGRALPQTPPADRPRSAFAQPTLLGVLVARELRDVLLNPRARLMLALPFFLAILLKLVGARALAEVVVGPQADAWLAGGLSSYGALVLGAGLAQNLFGYDAGGAGLLLQAPVDVALVIRAKNVVIGGLSLVLTGSLVAFYALWIAPLPGWVAALAVPNALFQVLLLLAVGNVLSILAPKRFHPSLRRRDRASPAATAVGLGAASLAVLPGSALLRLVAPGTPAPLQIGLFWLLPVLGLAAWRLSIRAALELLKTRRPELLRAVTRQ
jgi:ABC-2 type transport system permease protein